MGDTCDRNHQAIEAFAAVGIELRQSHRWFPRDVPGARTLTARGMPVTVICGDADAVRTLDTRHVGSRAREVLRTDGLVIAVRRRLTGEQQARLDQAYASFTPPLSVMRIS